MRKILLFILLAFLISFPDSYGQAVLFNENFESGEMPLNWKEEFNSGAINWRFENGGYTTSPAIPNTRKPISAHGGVYNALFQYQSINNEATKLVTRKIASLEFAIKPELHFYHAQMDWTHYGDAYHDYLKVYYKNGANKPWTLLRSYTEATSGWVERIILLPENSLSGDYYLAFEGTTNWGWGTCIDDIQIIETGVQPKTISDISVEQASDVAVSSGTDNNPILKVKLKVIGNSGTLPLNSLTLNALNTDNADIKSGGVKIYHTLDAEFSTDQLVGSGVSISSGQAAFTNLNYNLPTGYSYLWITYDIEPGATHKNTIDAKIPANGININGITYLSSECSPEGSRTILQTLASDNFESGCNWTLSGEFECGTPMGLGGSQGNPDPTEAYSGTHVIGTDLTGLGNYEGDYEKLLDRDQYYAVSDTFDFTYYNDLSIRYMRFLNIGVNDEAFVKVSPDGGKTWKTAWYNASMILDDTWKLHEIDITALAARKSKVVVMYSLGTTNDYWQLSGWNIDDFFITGKHVNKDVGISRVIAPRNGCGYGNADSVTVMIRNYGSSVSANIIPLEYSFDGKTTIVHDTLRQPIDFNDSVMFTFKKKANLSIPDIYNFYVSTHMAADDDESNDAITQSLYIQPTINTAHTETFETKGGLWIPQPGSDPNWEWGVPGFGIMPPSGTKVWMTQLTSNYPDNDSSFVESVCYANTDGERKILKLKYWVTSEMNVDGAALQYSIDNGNNWQLLDTIINSWPWYNDTIQSLNSRGWSKSSDGWIDASVILPKAITKAPKMKFRMAFASDFENNTIGFAFDNFNIYNAPPDVGVSQIEDFTDACQEVNPDNLTVTIKNFGINKLKQNDTIIAGFDLNHVHVVTDTFKLQSEVLPGHTFRHTFTKKVNAQTAGNYNLTAYTLTEADPWFYLNNNDTTTLNFEVFPAPLINLLDTIQTRQPDTVTLRPYYDPDYSYIWHDNSTNREFHVVNRGWHIVKVTDNASAHLCSLKDSTYVELLFNDVGTAELVHPVNHCGLTSKEYLTVAIGNFGTDSILAGQRIAVAYELNGGTPVADTLVLTRSLYAKHNINFTFNKGPVDLSAKGTYHFKIYTSYGGDTVAINDTIVRSVEILGRPVVSIGPDATIQALSHTLDPGTGYEHYLWDNGVDTQTRTVSQSGTYWVQVFDENECDNSDTVSIILKIRDVSVGDFSSPLSSCQFSASVPVTMRILNSGTDTVPGNTVVDVSYVFNSSGRVTTTTQLSEPLFPGQYVLYTFPGAIDLSTPGDYNMEATAVVAGDIRVTNDTSRVTIYRYTKPVVDFGLANSVVVNDVSLAIDAGYSPYYNYYWQDASTEHNIVATSSGIYHCIATDTRTQCYDRDTVIVSLIYADVGISWTDMATNGCTGTYKHVKVKVKNLGTSNIGPSYPIYVACDVNGTSVTVDTLTRSSQFYIGNEITLQLSGNITVNTSGNNTIAFYTLFGQDKKSQNDTLVMNFETLQGPVIDFGDDDGWLNNVTLPYALDAGDGHKSYTWQDNSTTQIYLVNDPGIYSVTVIGQNDCQSSKTVRINMPDAIDNPVIDILGISIYPNPNDGLFRISIESEADEELTVQIINNLGQFVFVRKMTAIELNNEFIDVQDLSRGLYLMLIQSEHHIYQGKFIKR
jgi:hypothetical protein